MRRGATAFATAMLVAMVSIPANAGFTPINDATSGSEIDLWVALGLVARDPEGGFSWTSTALPNGGAGGRRVDDDSDQVWIDNGTEIQAGSTVTVGMSALFWGGQARASDALGRRWSTPTTMRER